MVAVVSDFRNLLCCPSLYVPDLKCGDQNCTACSRCCRIRDLYNGRISSLFLCLKFLAMNSVAVFAAFLRLFLPLEVIGDDDSLIPMSVCCRLLLIGHVILAVDVVVSDLHHRTFIYIETHLPFVCPLNKFIDIFLYFSYVISVSSSVSKFGIICKFRHFAENIGI